MSRFFCSSCEMCSMTFTMRVPPSVTFFSNLLIAS